MIRIFYGSVARPQTRVILHVQHSEMYLAAKKDSAGASAGVFIEFGAVI